MAQVIKIKRSTTTATPADSSLGAGELAYSSSSNKLFIGHPDGSTAAPQIIGGKLYTDMLDHTAGTLTASSAIVVDSSSKIDRINVDNLRLDGNAITSTDTNGDITITPNGTGDIVLDGQNWPQADGSADQYLKTDGSGQLSWDSIPSGSFTISDNAGTPNTDTFTTGQTLTFAGGTDITTTVSDNQVSIAYSGNTPAIYDNSGSPALETGITAAEVRSLIGVDASGTDNSTDVTLANTNYLSLSGQELTGGTVPVGSGGTGATTVAGARTALGVDPAGTDNSTNVTLTSSVTDVLSISGQAISGVDNAADGIVGWDESAGKLTFLSAADVRSAAGVDAAGTDNSTDVTLAGSNNYLTISGQAITRNDVALGTHTSGNYVATVAGTANEITVSGSGSETAAVTIGLPDDVTIGDALTVTGDGSVGGNLTVTGNLTVSGTTTTVNSETVTFDDNILVLNNNFSGSNPTEHAGLEVERGTQDNAAFRWNETLDKWQVSADSSTYNSIIHDSSDIDGGTF